MEKYILKGQTTDYKLDKSICLKANGKFNDVFLGQNINDGKPVIIKMLNQKLSENQKYIAIFKNEKNINFQNPYIAKTLDYIQDNNNHYIIRQYIHGTDLKNIYKKNIIPNKYKLKFYTQCLQKTLSGLEFIHQNNIIHCDIKPSNIIVEIAEGEKITHDHDFNIKIIDFGLSKVGNENYIKDNAFSLIYAPPELILKMDNLINPSTDLYATAITFYELMTGRTAFYHNNPEIIINLMLNYKLTYTKNIPPILFDILEKAASKLPFGKPPWHYSQLQKLNIVQKGQELRYQTAEDMNNELKNFISKFFFENNKKKSIFGKIFAKRT